MAQKRTPTPGTRKARLVIVDDHALVRRGMAALMEVQPDLEVVGEAANAEDALRIVESSKPDLAIIDIHLGETSGIELMKSIRARVPSVRMLACSMYDESLFSERVLNAGGAGYVNKAEPTNTIMKAIHEVLDGRIYMSQP